MTNGWLGVIEGYYGMPLTHEQRLAFLEWMPTEGLDVYCYAPKDDPLHRHQWRDPYPDDDMASVRSADRTRTRRRRRFLLHDLARPRLET